MTQERGAPAQVERALQSVDPEERRRAVGLVAAVPLEDAVPLLMRALGDEDWRVRKEATFAARELLPADELLAALVRVLDSRDVGLCNAAVDVLGAAGAAATPHLVSAMATLGPDGRKLAVEALGSSRDRAALGPLSAALHDVDPNVRQTAAESIASLSAVAPDEVESVLLRLLDDADPIVKLSALAGLDTLGAVLPWDRLAPLLDNATLRPLALAAVARAGHAGAPAVLARALGASSGRAFDAALAAFALVPLDPLPEAAIDALRPYEPAVSERLVRAAATGDDEAIERRRTALLVAAALGAPTIMPVAVDALGHPDLGDAAQTALERLGTPAVDALVARLDSRCSGDADLHGDACAQCIEALAHIAERNEASRPAVLAALRGAVRVRSPRVAAQALYALGALGDAEDLALAEAQFLAPQSPAAHAAEAALAALASRHPAAARALWDAAETAAPSARPAAVALGALAEVKQLGESEPRALRFLSQAAGSDEALTRRAAVSALASVGGAPAVEVLVYALADEEREVRRTAARGIGRLAALGDNAKLLNVVRASSDPELLAAAVRSAGDYLLADGAPPEVVLLPGSRPPSGARGRGISSAPPWIAGHFAPKSPVPVAPSTHNLIAELSVMCEDPSPDVANAALDALRRAPTEVRVQATARALGHPEVDVVKTAVVKLSGARGSDAAAPPFELPSDVWEKLRRLLDHDRADVRLLVVESICLLDPDRGRDALVERAQSERDSDVLMAIDAALSVAQRQKKGSGAS